MHGAKAPAGGCIILLGATWQGISGLLATGFGSESCQRGVPRGLAFYHPDSDGARESEGLLLPAGSRVGVDRGSPPRPGAQESACPCLKLRLGPADSAGEATRAGVCQRLRAGTVPGSAGS